MKKLSFVVFCLIAASCGKENAPAQYNYKTIQVTSIYTNWKKDKETAMQKAEAEFGPFSKAACRNTIATGWSLTEVTDKGEMNCEETPEGHHCRIKNAELKCQQVIAEFPS
ncbi:MAG: hypothetical protein ACRESZ_03645 [Methylococcales bacterium]